MYILPKLVISRQFIKLGTQIRVYTTLPSTVALSKHQPSCPVNKQCPSAGASRDEKGGKGGGGYMTKLGFKRAEFSGKCRMGFIPEEWFTFFYPKTGVSGLYVFGLVLTNYLMSKEIYVMEHEYYSGLSVLLVIYLIATRMGPAIGKYLDKQVDAAVEELEESRNAEMKEFQDIIKDCKDAQWRAEGQKDLMEAKKENVAMQLEAEYRERAMRVYHTVMGRMDYHIKKYYAEARIQQKWMIDWILQAVMKEITPGFEKRALDQAIKDLDAAAARIQ